MDKDLSDILLPKKDPEPGKTLDSASRINAGALLEQEQGAALPKQEAPKPVILATKKEEGDFVPAIETYQGDIEKLVEKKNVSVVSIASAEAARRSSVEIPAPQAPARSHPFLHAGASFAMFVGGLLLIVLAGAAAVLIYERTRPLSAVQTDDAALFITTDRTQSLVFAAGPLSRATVLNNLESARRGLAEQPGIIVRFLLAQASSTQSGAPPTQLDAQHLLLIIAPSAPQELVRSLTKNYLVGVHSYDGNNPFLILETDSYQQAFSGMLKWEAHLRSDLSPFFGTPALPQAPQQGTTTASTTPAAPAPPIAFEDAVVGNFDTRVARGADGNTLFVWTFLDAHTVLLATKEATLDEVLSRRTLSQGAPQ